MDSKLGFSSFVRTSMYGTENVAENKFFAFYNK